MWILRRSLVKDISFDQNAFLLSVVRYFQSSKKTPVINHNHNKLVSTASEALSNCIFPGAVVAVGGFGLGGLPETLLNQLSLLDNARNLTIVHLTAGIDDYALGKLIQSNKVKRICSSYVGENKVSF